MILNSFFLNLIGKKLFYSELSDSHIQLISEEEKIYIHVHPYHQQDHTSYGPVKNIVTGNIFYINGKNIGGNHKQYGSKNGPGNRLSESCDLNGSQPVKQGKKNKIKKRKGNKSDNFGKVIHQPRNIISRSKRFHHHFRIIHAEKRQKYNGNKADRNEKGQNKFFYIAQLFIRVFIKSVDE